MDSKNIYNLGEKLGMNKVDIEDILKHGVKSCAMAALPIGVLVYKNGGYYGTISIFDF